MFSAGISGYLAGFIGNIPVAGPVMAIILKRCLSGQYRGARSIAIGSAFAEGIYAFAAFWGFGSALEEFAWAAPVARAFGAIIIFVVGVHFVRSPSLAVSDSEDGSRYGSRRKGVALGFVLTAINPAIIATWSVMVTFLFGLEILDFSWTSALAFAIGTTLGMTSWGLVMVHLVRTHQKKWAETTLIKIQYYLGIFLIGLGAVFLGVSVKYLWNILTGI